MQNQLNAPEQVDVFITTILETNQNPENTPTENVSKTWFGNTAEEWFQVSKLYNNFIQGYSIQIKKNCKKLKFCCFRDT